MSPAEQLLEAALALAATGVPVFPCTGRKVPAIPGGHGHLDATTDPDEVRNLFTRAPWAKLIGVATGARSGLDILDIDPRHGGCVTRSGGSGPGSR